MSKIEYDSEEFEIEQEAQNIVKARRAIKKNIVVQQPKTNNVIVQNEDEMNRKIDMIVKEKVEIEQLRLKQEKLNKIKKPRTEKQIETTQKMLQRLKEKRDNDTQIKKQYVDEKVELAKTIKKTIEKKKIDHQVRKKLKEIILTEQQESESEEEEEIIVKPVKRYLKKVQSNQKQPAKHPVEQYYERQISNLFV
jgi:hypothetical protein